MKQPDRFDRLVEENFDKPEGTWLQNMRRVSKFLRDEHRWTVRMVQSVSSDFEVPWEEKIVAILSRLEQRRK